MKSITIGIALTLLGVVLLGHAGSNLNTHKNILNEFSIKGYMAQSIAIQMTPIAGLFLLVGGIGIAIFANRIKLKFRF